MARQFAMATQAQLGKNLMTALQRGGTEEAIPFCNIKALPLTDSMARVTGTKIRRVTNKPRNPVNAANNEEVLIIEGYQQELAKGKTLQPVIKKASGNRIYYFPIITNTMCLQCHGKPDSDITPVTLDKLKTYYPQDIALGYGSNEVRGLWKVVPDPSHENADGD